MKGFGLFIMAAMSAAAPTSGDLQTVQPTQPGPDGPFAALLAERDREISRLRADLATAEGTVELAEAESIGLAARVKRSGLPERQQRRVLIAIVREARRNGLDPLLVAAVIHAESSFDPYAVSPVGAMGLMQVMPGTGHEVAARLGEALGPSRNLFDAEFNIELGSAYLGQMVEAFGSVEAALVAYNVGPSAARPMLANAQARQRLLAGYPRAVGNELRRLEAARNQLARPVGD